MIQDYYVDTQNIAHAIIINKNGNREEFVMLCDNHEDSIYTSVTVMGFMAYCEKCSDDIGVTEDTDEWVRDFFKNANSSISELNN